MHIYNNLNDDVKVEFRKDLMILILTTMMSLYCTLVLSLSNAIGHFSYELLLILGLNLIYSVISSVSLLNKIRYNKIDSEEYEDSIWFFKKLIYSLTSIVIIVYYYIDISKYDAPFIYLEFAPMLLYTVVYGAIFLYFFGKVLINCGSGCINFLKETKEAVAEREHLLKTKVCAEEVIIQQ